MKSTAAITVFAIFSWGCRFSGSEEVRESFPRVVTSLGTIEGYYKTSLNRRRYEAYEGIPYAQPPIGELRFEIPRRIKEWKDVWMAKEPGPRCMQYNEIEPNPATRLIQGVEDCLHMNIYTPIRVDGGGSSSEETGARNTSLQPVIFYIHGGSFNSGTGSSYGPKYLLDANVTLVTINYRLGPLGFLSTEDETVPGNMGLKDQVLALLWVKDHIHSFGGDPSKVTIFGQSAGGASVHYHYLTKLTTGLFRGGMSLSGSALNCWAQDENSLEKAKQLAAMVGCRIVNVRLMVDCLKTTPAHQIIEAAEKLMSLRKNFTAPFSPVVEKQGGEFTFIDRSPIEIITSGEAQDVPWITGVVSEEGLFPVVYYVNDEKVFDEWNSGWETIAPQVLDFDFTIPRTDHPRVARSIKQHYLGRSPFGRSTINQTLQMLADRWYVYDANKAARLQALANKSPVRFYYFSYRGAHSMTELMSGSRENFGVSHEDDVAYVLDSSFDPTTTPQDRDMQKKLIDLWVSFATDGVPDVGVEWPTVNGSTNEFRYMHIAGPTEIGIMENGSISGEETFWHSLGFEENILYDTSTANNSCQRD